MNFNPKEIFEKLNSRETSQKLFHENECSLGRDFQFKIKEQGISAIYKWFTGSKSKREALYVQLFHFQNVLFMTIALHFSNDVRM